MTKYQQAKIYALLREAALLRDGGSCLRCHKTTSLQLSHIYPKGRYKKLEFDLDNVKVLCSGCHLFWWHKNPVEAHEWLEKTIDSTRLNKLCLRSQYVDKQPLDSKMICLFLQQEIKSLSKDIPRN